jgi:hypothetical protein
MPSPAFSRTPIAAQGIYGEGPIAEPVATIEALAA